MNSVHLLGRTTKDIELKSTQSGKPFIRFTLAVKRPTKDDGSDFIGCVAFGPTAETMARHIKKGNRVLVNGHISTDSYQRNGETVYSTNVVVEQFEFIEAKPAQTAQNKPVADNYAVIEDDEDLPF